MTAHACPCCGAALAKRSRLDDLIDAARLTPMQERVVRVVARLPGLQSQDLAGEVYAGHRDGGPDHAGNLVVIHASAASRKLQGFGVRVAAGMGSRDGYQLIWEGQTRG